VKYLRRQADGAVFIFNEVLAERKDFDVFESRNPPPETIENLMAYVAEQNEAKKARRVKVEEETAGA
jgi:hypothetical protein